MKNTTFDREVTLMADDVLDLLKEKYGIWEEPPGEFSDTVDIRDFQRKELEELMAHFLRHSIGTVEGKLYEKH